MTTTIENNIEKLRQLLKELFEGVERNKKISAQALDNFLKDRQGAIVTNTLILARSLANQVSHDPELKRRYGTVPFEPLVGFMEAFEKLGGAFREALPGEYPVTYFSWKAKPKQDV